MLRKEEYKYKKKIVSKMVAKTGTRLVATIFETFFFLVFFLSPHSALSITPILIFVSHSSANSKFYYLSMNHGTIITVHHGTAEGRALIINTTIMMMIIIKMMIM